jgi:hypothetical protein
MRGHASDPTWQPDVIRHKATESEMQWGRWSDWRKSDPRWRVRILDASDLPKERVADELAQWIAEERALVRSANHPLSDWARGPRPRSRA